MCQCVQLLCSSQATIIHIIFKLTCTVIGRTGEMNANEGIFVTEFVYYNEKIKMSIHSHAAPILIYLSLRMSKNELLSSELDETFSNIASTQQTGSVKLAEITQKLQEKSMIMSFRMQ